MQHAACRWSKCQVRFRCKIKLPPVTHLEVSYSTKLPLTETLSENESSREGLQERGLMLGHLSACDWHATKCMNMLRLTWIMATGVAGEGHADCTRLCKAPLSCVKYQLHLRRCFGHARARAMLPCSRRELLCIAGYMPGNGRDCSFNACS